MSWSPKRVALKHAIRVALAVHANQKVLRNRSAIFRAVPRLRRWSPPRMPFRARFVNSLGPLSLPEFLAKEGCSTAPPCSATCCFRSP
jgi:hypothetical protein